jgi:hypothetical protein
MDTFRWIGVTFSMILGLGITRVLAGGVAVFRSRRHARIYWLPLAWGAAIFVLQIQFWWAILELPRLVPSWGIVEFLLLLGVPVSLFVAAAMVLPPNDLQPGEDLAELFDRDGRWGVVCLSIYAALAFSVDWVLFHEALGAPSMWFLIGEFVLPLTLVPRAMARARPAITLIYLGLVLWSSWVLSPKEYLPDAQTSLNLIQ